MSVDRPSRREALTAAAVISSSGLLAACDPLNQSRNVRAVVDREGDVTRTAQRVVLSPGQLAPEYAESDISPVFKANGSIGVTDPAYAEDAARGFTAWRLEVAGLVKRPLSLSLADLRARPSRTQITRHDCVEGWSCIGKWTGAPLGPILEEAGLTAQARYILFQCWDLIDPAHGVAYYESIGLEDARHPQTVLAYNLNDAPLTTPHGAPVRLRVERQLGYKQAKYIRRILAVDSLKPFGAGNGGYWEDSAGYEWYGGI